MSPFCLSPFNNNAQVELQMGTNKRPDKINTELLTNGENEKRATANSFKNRSHGEWKLCPASSVGGTGEKEIKIYEILQVVRLQRVVFFMLMIISFASVSTLTTCRLSFSCVIVIFCFPFGVFRPQKKAEPKVNIFKADTHEINIVCGRPCTQIVGLNDSYYKLGAFFSDAGLIHTNKCECMVAGGALNFK